MEREDGLYWIKMDDEWNIAHLQSGSLSMPDIAHFHKDEGSVLYKHCWRFYRADGIHHYYLREGQELGEIGPRIIPPA